MNDPRPASLLTTLRKHAVRAGEELRASWGRGITPDQTHAERLQQRLKNAAGIYFTIAAALFVVGLPGVALGWERAMWPCAVALVMCAAAAVGLLLGFPFLLGAGVAAAAWDEIERREAERRENEPSGPRLAPQDDEAPGGPPAAV
ncbi:MAG: hypothetical protein KDA44_10395 [Planctomycetales bacterium]|nr:hypothetical protein [Planctomycetales bacterium]